MKMNKYLCIIIILFITACREQPKPISKPEVVTIFDANFEILNGKVKQLTEIAPAPYSGNETTVTGFDLHGNATQTINKSSLEDDWKYAYKYDKNGKKTQLTAYGSGPHPEFKQRLYKYDTTVHIIEMSFPIKQLRDDSDTELARRIFRYQYNMAGDMVQMEGYGEKKHQFTKRYCYNPQHFLILIATKDVGGQFGGQISYKYLSVDKQGNWLKRIAIPSYYDAGKADTITRRITYY